MRKAETGFPKLTIKVFVLLFLSVLIKIYFFRFNQGIIGPDASEYLAASDIFKVEGWRYILSNNPITFWRLPLLPFIIFVCNDLRVLYVFQLLLSYFVAYNIYKIIFYFFNDKRISLITALTSLFLPYINIIACSPLSEFLQVCFVLFIFRKILYKEYGVSLVITFTLLCFLRAEGFIFVLFFFARELFLKQKKNAALLAIPFFVMSLWMTRNYFIFEKFSMVNPILSSRAMIGSIYNFLYVSKPNEFHTKHDYYKGFDYVNSKEYVSEYKELVNSELKNYIISHPIKFLLHRIYWVTKGFSYLSLGGEILPDKNWHMPESNNWYIINKINSYWSYSNLIAEKDYLRLFLRVCYQGLFALGHFTGLFFILYNFRKFNMMIFLFLTFSFVFIVEADMRYFVTLQVMSFSFFCVMIYNLIHRIRSRKKTSAVKMI